MPSSQVRLPVEIASAGTILEENTTAIRRPSVYRPCLGALAALDTLAGQGNIRSTAHEQELDGRTLRGRYTLRKNAAPKV